MDNSVHCCIDVSFEVSEQIIEIGYATYAKQKLRNPDV